MRYVRVARNGTPHLVAIDGDTAYDLTSARDGPGSLRELLDAAGDESPDLDALAREWVPDADRIDFGADCDRGDLDGTDRLVPVRPPEVWAAGVTYEISEEARQAESDMPDVYVEVYESERPELFFKATPTRTVGPGEAIGIRGDSTWNVPEPELGVVLYRGEVVGFTVGNDVSSRSIEGENPLYLPQAKVYDRCCALGPCVASAATVGDPHALAMRLEIRRDGAVVWEGETNTDRMVRTCEELASYLTRHNPLPDLTVLLTGTALVPNDEFTLRAGDAVTIDLESIGTLENPVTSV